MTSRLRKQNINLGHIRPTTGDIKTASYSTDHWGWLKCDGREVEIGDFQFLQDVIGTSFGGSGTKFRLPDARGRVEGMIGAGTGLTSRSMGDTVGAETHTLTEDEMPSHTHTGTTDSAGLHSHSQTDPQHSHSYTVAGTNNGDFTATPGEDPAADGNTQLNTATTNSAQTGISVDANGTHSHTLTTNATGGDEAHNNMQPTLFTGNMFIYCGRPTYGGNPF